MPRPAGSYRHSRQHETLETITISGYFGWNLITVFCFFLFMARSCECWKWGVLLSVVLVQNHHHSTYNTFTSITDLGLHQLSPWISYNSPDWCLVLIDGVAGNWSVGYRSRKWVSWARSLHSGWQPWSESFNNLSATKSSSSNSWR